MPASNLLITDPVCFKRTATGDLQFPLEYASGLEAVAIGSRTRLKLTRTEWFLNFEEGMPWIPTTDGRVPESSAIMGEAYDPVKTRAATIRVLLRVPSVYDVPVIRLTFNSTARILAITWVSRSLFGDTEAETFSRSL